VSQRETVLRLLREHPTGICVADVPPEIAYTLRNRISELHAHGHPIVSRVCRQHKHGSAVRRYSLTGEVDELF